MVSSVEQDAGLQMGPITHGVEQNTSIGMKGIYGNWKFPRYEFREYPKIIRLGNGKKVKVGSKKEEITALSESPLPDTPENPLVADNESLKKQLAEMQDQLNRLLPLVNEKIAKAGEDVNTRKAEEGKAEEFRKEAAASRLTGGSSTTVLGKK